MGGIQGYDGYGFNPEALAIKSSESQVQGVNLQVEWPILSYEKRKV
jgi:hypothetical protein